MLLYEKKWLGCTYKQETIETDMSKLIEQYLGPQPAETDWKEMWAEGDSVDGGYSDDSAGTGLAYAQSEFAKLLQSGMTEEARRKCMREFQLSTKPVEGGSLEGRYLLSVYLAVSDLGRQVEASDIPTFAQVRAQWAREQKQP